MRILLSNKVHFREGGASIYTLNLEELLRANGHEVAFFAMAHPLTLDSKWNKYFPSEVSLKSTASKLRFIPRCLGDRETASNFKAMLEEFKPDVVHLNNIHSQLSPIIAEIAHKKGCRVVWTLHDYKLLCPRYDCLRNGEAPCEECFSDKRSVLRHKCMKNSLPSSIIAYCEAIKWNRDRLEASTDAFICPSHFMKAKMEQGGFAPAKLHHLCNFIDVSKCERENYDEREDYYCFVGRLSHEKGVKTLTEVASRLPHRLVVVGNGPMAGELAHSPNIEYVGLKDWEGVKSIVSRARFMVIPSEWYENNPLSVIESLCLGTPVLGARIGGIPELIDEGRNGMTFESGDGQSLAEGIGRMFETDFDYQQIAASSLLRFSEEAYYESLMKLYQP
ncbi:MAG: glycosyltransferase [Bacteroidales bacterium]|nr:glycosyltransferase [Bacteroidales bacterium]